MAKVPKVDVKDVKKTISNLTQIAFRAPQNKGEFRRDLNIHEGVAVDTCNLLSPHSPAAVPTSVICPMFRRILLLITWTVNMVG